MNRPMDAAAMTALVQSAQAGDREALAEIYRQFAGRVFGLCRKLLGSASAAEDATGDVFVRGQQALAGYDPARPFDRWLLSIASHHCLNLLRRRSLERRLFADDADSAELAAPAGDATPLGLLSSAEQRQQVRDAVAALPDKLRLPLVLKYDAELSYDEISAALGISRDHVATLLVRAKQALRRELAARPEAT
jgi:RNA polymerase sigma-70 factor (ECF subfamily)